MKQTTPPPADQGVLDVSGVRLAYGRRSVLDQVNFRVRSGEFWFLIGPNGHGKSTLLSAMLGRLSPAAGKLVREGDFSQPGRIGFVPQESSTNPALPTTVREWVGLGLVGIRVSRAERAERLSWALGIVGMTGLERHDFWSVSGGQRQRALVARALIRRPRLLVGDEPTSGLDLSVETALYGALADLNRTERLTLILVTHDLAAAARYGTHIALVHNGRVEAGPTQEILQAGRLAAAYGVPVEVRREASGSVSVRLG
jgi:ABC-type Mn2+/Zn2+ transport system ATPase subunit